MRLLFLLQDLPYPPSDGIKWKTYNLIRYMSLKHECHILSFGDCDTQLLEDFLGVMPGVRILGVVPRVKGVELTIKRIGNIFRGLPPSMATYDSKAFYQLLRRAINEYNYDVIHYDIINMAQYLPMGSNKPSVHSPNDATSLSYFRMIKQEHGFFRRIYLFISAAFMRKFERRFYPRFTKVHVVSPVDAQYFRSVNSGIDVETIPIAVDESFVDSVSNDGVDCSVKDLTTIKILFSGSFDVSGIVNGLLEFIHYGYPKILKAFPNACFTILGRDAAPKLRKQLEALPQVECLSWVDDYAGLLKTATVVIAPDKSGTGIKNRVLQAMALGIPVVGTGIAFEGISVQDGIHGFVRDTADGFSDAVIMLLADSELRKNIGDSAKCLIKEKYTMVAIGESYHLLYRNAFLKFYQGCDEVKQSNVIF